VIQISETSSDGGVDCGTAEDGDEAEHHDAAPGIPTPAANGNLKLNGIRTMSWVNLVPVRSDDCPSAVRNAFCLSKAVQALLSLPCAAFLMRHTLEHFDQPGIVCAFAPYPGVPPSRPDCHQPCSETSQNHVARFAYRNDERIAQRFQFYLYSLIQEHIVAPEQSDPTQLVCIFDFDACPFESIVMPRYHPFLRAVFVHSVSWLSVTSTATMPWLWHSTGNSKFSRDVLISLARDISWRERNRHGGTQ
jgi:hypothetical protein